MKRIPTHWTYVPDEHYTDDELKFGSIFSEDDDMYIAKMLDTPNFREYARLIAASPLMHKELERAEQTLRNLGNSELTGDAQTKALNTAANIRTTLDKATS